MNGEGDPQAAIDLEKTLKGIDSRDEESFDDTLDALMAVASGKEPEFKDPEDKEEEDSDGGDIDPEVDEEEEEESESEEESEEMPKGLSKKLQIDWKAHHEAKKELRSRLKEAEDQRKTLASEVEELRQIKAEAEELRKQKDLFEEGQRELAIARVEGTQDYKESIKKPLDAIESQVVAIAAANEVSVERLFSAIEEPDPVKRRKALNEVTEDMNRVDQDEVFQMSRDAQTLLARQAEVREKAREGLKEAREREAAEKVEAERKRRTEIEKSAPHVAEELRKRFPLRKLDNEEAAPEETAFFEKMAEALKKHDFESDPLDRKMYQAAAGVLLKRATSQLAEAYEKIVRLESRVEKKNRTKPKIGDDSPPPAADDEGDIDDHVADFLGLSRSRDITQLLKGD